MQVDLPHQFDASSMHAFIGKTINTSYLPLDSEVIFNFSTLRFIRPSGITILSNLIEWLFVNGVVVKFILPSTYGSGKGCPIKYLDDSLFFEKYMGRKLLTTSSPRSTTIPLKTVKYEDSFDWIDSNLISWLSRSLYLSDKSFRNLKLCVGEIFNNIKDHSGYSIGCTFAQHFPHESTISLAISDFGVGIPHNIKKVLPSLSDSQAIIKSTEEGFSTKSTEVNTGAGLDILIHNIVLNNKGSVQIYSNCGAIRCSNDSGNIDKSIVCVSGYYPGTLIYCTLRTDTFETYFDESEDFEW